MSRKFKFRDRVMYARNQEIYLSNNRDVKRQNE